MKKIMGLDVNTKLTLTRGHSLKLVKQRSHLDIRKHFFNQRVVASWNSLPEHVVTAPNMNIFKNRLDHFWKHTVIKCNYKASHATSLRMQQLADVATMSGT